MLAQVSDAAATLFAVIITLLTAVFGAVWRIGSKLGGISQILVDHEGRLDRIEGHEDEHDRWHKQRGIV